MKTTLVIVLLGAVVLLIALPDIHRWEREAGFPYGKLCELYRTCK